MHIILITDYTFSRKQSSRGEVKLKLPGSRNWNLYVNLMSEDCVDIFSSIKRIRVYPLFESSAFCFRKLSFVWHNLLFRYPHSSLNVFKLISSYKIGMVFKIKGKIFKFVELKLNDLFPENIESPIKKV